MKSFAPSPPKVTGFRIAVPRALCGESTDPEVGRSLSCVSLSLLHADTGERAHYRLTLLEVQELHQALIEAEASVPAADEAVTPTEIVFRLEEGEVVYRLSTKYGRLLIDALDKALDRLRDEPPLIFSPVRMGYVIGWAAGGTATALHIKIDGEVDTIGAPRRILLDVRYAEDRITTVWLDDEDVKRLDRVLEGALVAAAAGTSGPVGQLFEGDPTRGAPPWLTISVQASRSMELRFEEDPEGGEEFRGDTVRLAEGSVKELRRLLREAMLAKGALPEAPVAPEGEILIEELTLAGSGHPGRP